MDEDQKPDTSSTVLTDVPASPAGSPRCRTVTLTDEPGETDAFSGPHQRIADAVAQLIKPKDAKGISIGIEGSWGSGKSTVARLLTKQLESDGNITVVSFDAWAHEGDPLRRTFLETIIRKLQDRKWVNKEDWDKCIEELANRREVVTTKDKLTITRSGWLIAFFLLLVPIGGAFITAALREDITVVWWGTPHSKFLIYILIGLALTFIPLLLLFLKTKQEPDILAFLFNKGPTEKTTETSKTANPTSIEFEGSFHRLFKEALEGDEEKQQRRVVLILDNLDRVDSKDALTIWSTLQTFLQHKGTSRPDWHERVWLLVLYDVDGLSKLWTNNNKNEAAKSFIDKSFQIRFEVPALVLSDWRQFLMLQLLEAFPDHVEPESDFHDVYLIVSIWIAKRGKHLTIRELKLFVNQIGSVHRQWAGDDRASDPFPLSLIAYYVLLRHQNEAIVNRLYDPEFPDKEYRELLGSTFREHLAALAFNVETAVAQQLLFSDKIINALTLGSTKELTSVASVLPRGFWEVFEEAAKKWASNESLKVADAALAIEESGILATGFGPSVWKVKRGFCDRVASVDAWSPMDERRAKGIAVLLKWQKELKRPEEYNEKFIDSLSGSLALGLIHVEMTLRAKQWLDLLDLALKELEPVTRQASLTKIVDTLTNRFSLVEFVPYQLELLLEVLCELHERPESALPVEERLTKLADTGKIASQLRRNTPLSDASVAWTAYVLIRYSTTLADPSVDKQDKEKVALLSTDPMVQSFVSILERYNDTALLFHVAKTAPELNRLTVASLKTVIGKDSARDLFVTDTLNRLEFVSMHLDHTDPEETHVIKLISDLLEPANLANEISSGPFKEFKANLYFLVLKAGGRNQKDFVSWCVEGLRSVESESWRAELYYHDRLLAMTFYLSDLGVAVDLGEQYFYALSGSLSFPKWQFVSDGHKNPAALIGPWGSVYREAFLAELEKRIRSDDVLPDWFFNVFGLELKTQLLDSSRGARVVELLPFIVKRKHSGGLIWLRDILMESSKSLQHQAWKQLTNPVRHALITQQPGTQTPVNSIASILNISKPKNGLIAFATLEQDKICTLDPNNLRTEVLIKGALPDYALVNQPGWSADGKKLVYVGRSEPSGQSEIFILDYSSGKTTKVPDSSMSSHQPSLSQDGKMLALVRGKGPYSDIFIVNLKTGEERKLTATDSINERPQWSPDGTRLVFRRIINHKSHIFVMSADGSNEILIAPGPADFDPTWSPDERYITFVRLEDIQHKGGIYSVSLEGAAVQFIPEKDVQAPVWSPDGTTLLFQAGMDADARIYQVDANGQNKKELTKGVSPTWQPVFDDDSPPTNFPRTGESGG